MYNVKRIGVWKYESKMGRDWPPPTLSLPLPIYLRQPLKVQSSATWDPRWTFLSQLEGAK